MSDLRASKARDIPARVQAERRARLLAAIRPDDGTRRPVARWFPGPRALMITTACALSAVALSLVLLLSAGRVAAPEAQAAILRHIAAALTTPPGMILHERAIVSGNAAELRLYELWAQADMQRIRVIKSGRDFSWDGSTFASYDAAANTITVKPNSQPPARPTVDYAVTLRELVESGKARIDRTTTIGGVAAYELSATATSAVLPGGTTAYVSTTDYHPLIIDYRDNGGATITYQKYEYLPGTSANLALLSLAAQHPAAKLAH
jgi:outer membrane lipoprotein-sorting protein